MSELIEDVKVIPDRGITTDQVQILINNGTKKLSSEVIEKDDYLADSFAPNQSWRLLNNTEDSILISSVDKINQWKLGNCIGLLQVSDYVIKPLRDKLKLDNFSIAGFSQVSLKTDYYSIIEKISTYLQSYLLFPDEISYLGIQKHRPGLLTSTVDSIRYLPKHPRVGLHLDSWQKLPLRRRHLSRNRICINIGCETRYFLFINLSILKMAQLLGLSTATDFAQFYRGIEIPDKFMKAFPNYPVIKLALPPNMAYIAPTENIIHDATSLDKAETDFSLTFLGKFGIKKY
jgi:hypothetical protein